MQETSNYLSRGNMRRRRRRAYVFLLTVCVAAFVFVAGGWLFASSPLFRVQKVDITGNNLVSRGDVLGLIQARMFIGAAWWKPFLGAENTLAWPNKHIGTGDSAFYPVIKSISISKNYFTRTIFLKVEERKPIGIWCYQGTQMSADSTPINADERGFTAGIKADTIGENPRLDQRESASPSSSPRQSAPSPRTSALALSEVEGSSQRESASGCWWFDDEGVIFRRSPSTEGNLIVVVNDYSQKGGGLNSKILPDRFMGNFLSVLGVMQKSTLDEKEILIKDLAVEEVEVLTGAGSSSNGVAGPRLYFSLRFPADAALSAIEHMQGKPGFKNLRYIDFRVENKVYYR